MKHLRSCLLILALLLPAAVCAQEKRSVELIGQFMTLDRSTPGCGVLFVGSKAAFVTQTDQQTFSLVVPCIEMQTVKTDSGQTAPLELHKTYRILVTPLRPKNMNFPAASADLLYLIEVLENKRPAA